MTCRFLIALQSADRRVVGGGSTSGVNADGQDTGADGGNTLRFASRIVGSISRDLGRSYLGTADEFDENELEVDEEDATDLVPDSPAQDQTDSAGDHDSACSKEEKHPSSSQGEGLEV